MKISEIITDKYKLRMPPTVYYELLADVVEAEEEQEPKVGHWIYSKDINTGEIRWSECSVCGNGEIGCAKGMKYCPKCGAKMEDKE